MMKGDKPNKFKNHLPWYIKGILIIIILLIPIVIFFCSKQEAKELLEILPSIAGFLTVLIILITLMVEARQFKIRQFENAFFNMTDFYNRIVENLKDPKNKNGFGEQREMLKYFYYEVVKELKLSCNGGACKIGKNTKDIFNKYNHELNHYFRHIFSIIKYVNESKILNESGKNYYNKAFFHILSRKELIMIGIFAHCEQKNDKNENLVEELKKSGYKKLMEQIYITGKNNRQEDSIEYLGKAIEFEESIMAK